MAGEPVITVIGNLGGDPELRFTASGHAVANFSIAQTPRRFDQNSQQWVDDEALWFRCSAWRELGENVAETFTKGMRVIATGRLRASAFEDKQGNQRVGWELQVDDIGPSLRWATAQVTRSQPGGNNNAGAGGYANQNPWGNSQYNQPQGGQQPNQQQGQDPWGAAQQGGNVWAGGQPQGQPQGQQTDAFGVQSDGPPPF